MALFCWFFLLLMGISLFILRRRRGGAKPPFAVPLYPLLPAIFCLTSAYLLYASLAYAGLGATVGAGVVAAGGMLRFFLKPIGRAAGRERVFLTCRSRWSPNH